MLKKWVESAGINKHITWHCARHTFATSLVYEDVGINTVSALLGHKDLRQTQIYVRTAELSKTNAISKLPNILLN
ncbi:tyrosine-type recombinase/integrase [Cloacibacterium sp. TD35]|uniref:tyrosine-type recombinase/integrase n=1 Tax=Cloacibacterium sp. TD35 TaxID=2976818 RepID=UPI00406BF0D1